MLSEELSKSKKGKNSDGDDTKGNHDGGDPVPCAGQWQVTARGGLFLPNLRSSATLNMLRIC